MATYYPRCAVAITLLMEDWGTGASTTYTLTVVPRQVEILRNDHRTADTCTITLDFRDFPFDPRTFAAGIVQVALADVGAPDGTIDVDASLQFAGVIDTPKSTRAEDGATVTLECRDFTAYFLDHMWASGAIKIDVPLVDVLAAIVAEVPGADGLQQGFSNGLSSLTLSDVFGRTVYCPQPKDDAWTILCDLCGRVGAVPVVSADMLLILTPADFGVDRNAFMQSGAVTPLSVTMAYGSNVRSLGYLRRFKEARTLQVEVRAWDEAKRKVTTARYPTSAVVTKRRVSASGTVKEDAAPILPFYVSGAYTDAQLAEVAERVWTEAARQEIEITLETMDLADLDGAGLPSVGNGTRLTVDIQPSIAADIASESQAEAIARLTSGDRALAVDVATAFVAGFQSANNLAVQFYVREARHSWGRDEGYKVSMTAINYIMGSA